MLSGELAVLEAIAQRGDEARPDDIVSVLANKGEAGAGGKVRSRLQSLTKKGHVVRQDRGEHRGAYRLTHQGKERLLIELAESQPSSLILKKAKRTPNVVLTARVEAQDEGGFLAVCGELRGCLAEGNTVAEALANLEDAARAIFELHRREGWPLSETLEFYRGDRPLEAQIVVRLPG